MSRVSICVPRGSEIQRRFAKWFDSLEVLPTLAALRARADEIVAQVLRENDQRWQSLSADDRQRVELMARAVVSRLLHEPTLRLKESEGDRSYVYVDALRELFGLEGALGEQRPADVASLEEARRKQSRSG